ncbi:MAG: rhodanese-like domain-containing protein [Burkholderiales bacterium]
MSSPAFERAGELSKSDPVVVFCVYGFHVGGRTAVALRDAGFDARYMKGGHSGWKASVTAFDDFSYGSTPGN